jgi:hypothetical protein
MLQSKNKYIDFEGVAEYLAKRDYSEAFDPKDFMDETSLMRDIHLGDALEGFFSRYKDVKLDVVSLAEVQTMIDDVLEVEEPHESVNDLAVQIGLVLEHVEQQMSCVSHSRRSQITLGEFMTRHHYMNNKSYRHYSSDLLKSQIESALGQGES